MQSAAENRITEQQLELLKSFKYLRNEKEISEVKELLSLYYEHKLDAAIERAETERNYTAEVYQAWLNQKGNSEK
jgi:hypothetical protein